MKNKREKQMVERKNISKITSKKASKKVLKILKQYPTLEEDIQYVKDKSMTPEVAENVFEKAEKILAKNFKGKQLKKMQQKLKETMKDLQRNQRVKNLRVKRKTK